MKKLIWNLVVMTITCNCLLLTNVYAQQTNDVVTVIKEATTTTVMADQYKNLELYKHERQQDVVMLVISQVTSRLKACSQPPDMVAAIAAGKSFINGEVAEYAEAVKLKKQMEEILATTVGEEKQLAYFYKLRQSYNDLLVSARNKQSLRNLSNSAFQNAAAMASAEAVEDETLANTCKDTNTQKTNSGKSQGDDMNILKLACQASMMAICHTPNGQWACKIGMVCGLIAGEAKKDANSCSSGGAATSTNIIDRAMACDQLGTFDMFSTSEIPTTTASRVITDRCLASGETVNAGAGQGCQNYSSSGSGPYTPCDVASAAYRRNMVACPVTVLQDAKTADLGTSGINEDVGKEFIKQSSEKVSRALDIRMASPRQRLIVWGAFADFAKEASDTNILMIAAIQTQLDKIQRIITDLEKLENGVKLALPPKLAGIEANTTAGVAANDITPNQNAKIGCTSNCNPTSDQLTKTDGFNNFSPAFQLASQQVATEFDGHNNNSSGLKGTNLSGGDISNASRKKAISDELARKSKLLQDLSSKNGKSLDIAKDTKDFKGSINTLFSNGKKSSQSSADLASLNANDKKGSDTNADKNGLGDGSKNYGAGGSIGSYQTGLGSNHGLANSNKGDGDNKDKADVNAKKLENPNDSNDARLLAAAIEARNKNSDKYNSSETNTLFEKVSNAYIRNFEKLLTRKTAKFETK